MNKIKHVISKIGKVQLAKETVKIQQRGEYTAPSGRVVSVQKLQKAAVAGARLYTPEDYEELLEAVTKTEPPNPNIETKFSVISASTLEAGAALRERYERVACLNFASAKNPGGGFLGGAEAQEESLARVSGLYTTLTPFKEGYYDYHRTLRTCLYSDRVIYSPDVPVFAGEDGVWLENPWTVSFITSAAVNAGAVAKNEPDKLPLLRATMVARTRMVLAVAAVQKNEALVLGAWGCGVFRNDPEMIAQIFAEVLAEPLFANRFAEIVFAIYNPKGEKDRNIAAFESHFAIS
jgi:uncharacterized protein (TIGR02452 family)